MRGSGRDQAASCLLAARYWFPCPLARSVGKASMSAAVSSLPQAPASFKRRGLTGRYTLTISPPAPEANRAMTAPGMERETIIRYGQWSAEKT
jgi:hypothetical protein